MKSLLKFAALALVGTATLASPAFAALKEGTQAPDFTAPAYLAGQPFTFKLADALKKGPVVVYFFPAPHTSGCNVEAHLFSQAIPQFTAAHATVIGVTAGNLDQHVRAVAAALRTEGLVSGRQSIAKIVGRDSEALDQAAICRAAIESLAENASDGVTAPALWYLVGGLPGMIAYKAINTADSMIGHRNDK